MQTSKLSTLFLITALVTGMSGQALALDVGQKGSFAEIEKDLAKEQQVEIARAKYVLHPEDKTRMKVLCLKFTINAQGDAYLLLSDNMDDAQAKTEMVYGKIKNASVYDPRNVGAYPQGVSASSSLGDFIKRASTTGEGVMLHGESVKRQPDGKEQVIGYATILANLSETRDIKTSDRVIIFNTANNLTSVDKVFGFNLLYRGVVK